MIEAALAVANGRPVADDVEQAFDRLPKAMARAEQRANRVEREAIDLAEAVVLAGREGHVFAAVVLDERDNIVEFQMAEPAVLGSVEAHHVDPGHEIRVRLLSVDVEAAAVVFERVA